MKTSFDISNLEILGILLFDSSIDFEDLNQRPINGKIELDIERRAFEDVKRQKLLFWELTKFQGKTSKLKIFGVKEIRLKNDDPQFQNNQFINEIRFNEKTGALKLITCFGLIVEYVIENTLRIELEDIRESRFGRGISFGKHGFTMDEWNNFLTVRGKKNTPHNNSE